MTGGARIYTERRHLRERSTGGEAEVRWLGRSRQKGLLQSVLMEALRDIYSRRDPETQQLLSAFVFGGSIAAGLALRRISALQTAWGLGSKSKARALTEVFSLAILSTWLAWTGEEDAEPEEDREPRRRAWAFWIMDSFGRPSQDRLTWFINYDKQYAYEQQQRKEGRTLTVSAYVLVDTALAALAGRAARGPTTDFPHRDLRDWIHRAGADLLSDWGGAVGFHVSLCLMSGFRASAKHYRGLYT